MSDASPGKSEGRGCVVMLSGDLMFSSRVKAAAQQAGFDFRVGFALPEEGTDAIRFVLLDLSTQSGKASEVVEQCAKRCPAATLIAYGPHVQVGKLEAARNAGIENVMTNGQFSSRLASLFAEEKD